MRAPYLFPHRPDPHRSSNNVAMGKLLLVSIGLLMIAAIGLAIILVPGFEK